MRLREQEKHVVISSADQNQKFGTSFDLEFTWLDSGLRSQHILVQTLMIHFQIIGLQQDYRLTISTPVRI